jgi:hypothetical protein
MRFSEVEFPLAPNHSAISGDTHGWRSAAHRDVTLLRRVLLLEEKSETSAGVSIGGP